VDISPGFNRHLYFLLDFIVSTFSSVGGFHFHENIKSEKEGFLAM
jgi:hypothetical protein